MKVIEWMDCDDGRIVKLSLPKWKRSPFFVDYGCYELKVVSQQLMDAIQADDAHRAFQTHSLCCWLLNSWRGQHGIL